MIPYMKEILWVCIGLNISILVQSIAHNSTMGIAVALLSMSACGLSLWINKRRAEDD
jgi:hypothetical protein